MYPANQYIGQSSELLDCEIRVGSPMLIISSVSKVAHLPGPPSNSHNSRSLGNALCQQKYILLLVVASLIALHNSI